MYRVIVSITFDAAHRLENYQGPCARLHGHTWKVTGEWERDQLDQRGITLDLTDLKKQLRSVVVDMDHNFLNRIRDLAKPTAENIAQLLFKRLSQKLPSGDYLTAVTIEETPGCSVRYFKTTRKQKANVVEAETDPVVSDESSEEPSAPIYKDEDKKAEDAST